MDAAKPVLRSVTLPNPTATQLVTVTIDATDDVGVTGVRLANENGVWQVWQPYTPTVQNLATPLALIKGVFVEVRDATGKESNVAFKTTLCSPCTAPARAIAALDRSMPALAPRNRRLRRTIRTGTLHRDRFRLGAGSQNVDLSQPDHRRDVVDCGAGFDTVLKRAEDVTRNCERVRVLRDPRGR